MMMAEKCILMMVMVGGDFSYDDERRATSIGKKG